MEDTICMNNKKFDECMMRRAIKLAKLSGGAVLPNPMVGAVVVKNGKVIGEGRHEMYGDKHAERNALLSCTYDPSGSTIYVTLEPCCHHGKQPPCTDALISAGVSRVVIGSKDPNPLASGKGIEILRNNGIDVETGVLKEECDQLNRPFFKYITGKIPFVTMKYAMTLDGKIATANGLSKWITSEESRKLVHKMRTEHMGIMVGSGTVLSDDPMLNARDVEDLDEYFSPVRIICDTKLITPLDSNVVKTARDLSGYRNELPRTIIATSSDDDERIRKYEERSVKILRIPRNDNGHISITDLMNVLGEEGICSILLEGGGTLGWSMLECGYVDRIAAFVSPKIFGGKNAKTPVSGKGVHEPSDAFTLSGATARRIGSDLLIEGDVLK